MHKNYLYLPYNLPYSWAKDITKLTCSSRFLNDIGEWWIHPILVLYWILWEIHTIIIFVKSVAFGKWLPCYVDQVKSTKVWIQFASTCILASQRGKVMLYTGGFAKMLGRCDVSWRECENEFDKSCLNQELVCRILCNRYLQLNPCNGAWSSTLYNQESFQQLFIILFNFAYNIKVLSFESKVYIDDYREQMIRS